MSGHLTPVEVVDVLRLFEGEDNSSSSLFWHVGADDELSISVDCSDCFDWATADGEIVTWHDVPLIRRCQKDLLALTGECSDLGWLYVARKRGIRPMPQAYRLIEELARPLFDAAGPPRDMAAEGILGSHRGKSTPWVNP